MEDPNRPQRKLSTAGDSLYKVLGLEKGASADEIKKAYRYIMSHLISSLTTLIAHCLTIGMQVGCRGFMVSDLDLHINSYTQLVFHHLLLFPF